MGEPPLPGAERLPPPRLPSPPVTLPPTPPGWGRPSHRPDWVKTALLWSRSNSTEIEFCTAEDLPTLTWAANLADIELHVTLARAEQIERPTVLAFDLDPGAPAGILECAQVALELRGLFERLGLESWVKTSGSKFPTPARSKPQAWVRRV